MAANLATAWKSYKQGDIEEAGKAFEQLTGQPQAPAQYHIQRGLFMLHIGNYPEAQESFSKARALQPKNPAPIFFLALSQGLASDFSSATATVAELKAACPHHQGIQSLELLQEIQKGDPLPLLGRFGYGPAKDTHHSRALSDRLMAGLGKGDPASLPAELSSSDYLLGPILLEVEKKIHPLEIDHLERHPDILPDDLSSIKPPKRAWRDELNQLGNSFKAGPPLRKGKNLFEKAYGVDDRQKQHGLLRRAAKFLRASRRLDPHGFRVSYHLGETYLFLARGEPGKPYDKFRLQQAQTSFLKSVEQEGINPYVLFYLAYVQHLLGRPQVAVRLYREATKKFEKLPEAHYGEGQCHLLLGDETEAKRLFLKAVNSDLALARERLELYTTLLSKHGRDHFNVPIPKLPPPPPEPEPEPETAEETAATEAVEEEPGE